MYICIDTHAVMQLTLYLSDAYTSGGRNSYSQLSTQVQKLNVLMDRLMSNYIFILFWV